MENNLTKVMVLEIFNGVFFEAKNVCSSDEGVSVTVDLTLKKLFQVKGSIYEDDFISSPIRLFQLANEMMQDVLGFDELLLEIYMNVVANDEFKLVRGEKKTFEVSFEIFGNDWKQVAGVADEEIEWSFRGVQRVKAFSEQDAEEMVIESIENQTDDFDSFDIQDVVEAR